MSSGTVVLTMATHIFVNTLGSLFSDLQPQAEGRSRTIINAIAELFSSLTERSNYQNKLVGILRKLWYDIVDPVVQALMVSNACPGSRTWWCPTAGFTLLSLQAAGLNERERDNLSQIYISSYTPTLATLVRARKQVSRDSSSQHFVAIAKRLKLAMSPFTSLEDSDATVQGALDALNHNQWFHLACHGMPNRQRPFQSSFPMRDGPLMIKDIFRSNWRNSEFAFLSAFHTTVGDEKSPDESIHLAAAMQFSGFCSDWHYVLADDSGRLDSTRAAVALHKAVKKLRVNHVLLEQQIVFIHMCVYF
ncbi:hypothetical protein BDR07DRAFT_1614503 [Suillus spraguei]|nr:hypothetical protein BDR07DRAFT_1614503 [Suillus spraguei]